MKRPVIATALTTIALVLLLNFKTPDAIVPNGGQAADTALYSGAVATQGAPSIGPIATPAATPGAITTPSAPSTTAGYSGVLLGQSVSMPYGKIQVQVTLAAGKIVDVVTLQAPSGGHSGQIATYAAPQLRSEVLSAQSAKVDTISGATYTSQAYLTSLQSALDKAV